MKVQHCVIARNTGSFGVAPDKLRREMTRQSRASNFFKGIASPLGFAMTVLLFLTSSSYAKVNKDSSLTRPGDDLAVQGRYESAAIWYLNFIKEQKGDEKTIPDVLVKVGETLEKLMNNINTAAERKCFRSGGQKGTPCMKAYAEELNAKYGAGAFEYSEQLVFIKYTGSHFKEVVEKFPKSAVAPKAAYMCLSKNLVGHPDQVLPRVKDYMSKYSSGEWGRCGRLLWARINEDIWWIHRKWSWVLYNWQISPEELIVKAEPYRQESLKTYEGLIKKDGSTEEGKIAKREYELLKAYQDDGKLYGIVNESDIAGTKAVPGHD